MDNRDGPLLRLREQLLGDLLLIDRLARHTTDRLDGLVQCHSFQSGQAQVHRPPDASPAFAGPWGSAAPRNP